MVAPIQPDVIPQWITNTIVAVGGILTILAGYIIRRMESMKESPASMIVAAGGSMPDSRAQERLVDQLGDTTRAVRDVETVAIKLCRSMDRLSEDVGDLRDTMNTRERADQAQTDEFVRRMRLTRDKGEAL